MRDSRFATHEAPDHAYEIARELHGILPFGARAGALARCPRLAERVDDGIGTGEHAAATLVETIESFASALPLDRHPEPLAPELVRRMLHVLLATRDLGWPGTDAPLSVRRVAAADLFFDATQTVLSDHDWMGPDGVEFALLTALAEQLCATTAPPGGETTADDCHTGDVGSERLGHLRRTQRPRGL